MVRESTHVCEAPCGIGQRCGGREVSQEVRLGIGDLQLTYLCYHIRHKTLKDLRILNLNLSFQIILKICFICESRTEHILLNNVNLVYNL